MVRDAIGANAIEKSAKHAGQCCLCCGERRRQRAQQDALPGSGLAATDLRLTSVLRLSQA